MAIFRNHSQASGSLFQRARQLIKAGQRKALGEPAYYLLNGKLPAVFDCQAGRQPGRIGKAVI